MARQLSAHQRGLGYAHRKRVAQLPDPIGTPCPRCGNPMLPGQKLDAGHTVDRALGGHNSPLRWEHARCNRRAGGRLGGKIKAARRGTSGQRRQSRDW